MVIDEMRKMALIIAKLLGLKAAGKETEFVQEVNGLMLKEYNTDLETLLGLNEEDFEGLINSDSYSSEKLNALSQVLYMFAEPFNHDEATQLLLKKVMLIFDVLEEKHHYQSFDNITKRNTIYKYFNITP
jgi:endonuclease III